LDQYLTISPAVITDLLRAAALQPGDTVLEIGAGTGLITRAIAARAGATIATELDRRFEPYLQRLHRRNGVSVHWADFRFSAPERVTAVVANPPFGVTEHLVDWLTQLPHLRRVALIVGQRFARAATAPPGSTQYTRLSLHLQAAFTSQLCGSIPPTNFYPPTRACAAILTLQPAAASPLLHALDAAVATTAGIRLHKLLYDLHGRDLLRGSLPALQDRLRPHLHRRIQQLTNAELSLTAHALLAANDEEISK